MAGKRQATSDLNHDNWDREEEPEEHGTFRTAPEEELKNRVIKLAKRKITARTGSDTADGGSGTKSVFSGFAGFGKPTAAAKPPTSSSPFSFLSKIPAIAVSTSGVVSSSTSTTSATPTFSFGIGSAAATTTSNTIENEKTSSSTKNPAATTPSKPFTASDNNSNFSGYYRSLSNLNQAVCEWIKTHVDKNPVCILTPIFKDYEKHLEKIEIEKKKEESKQSTTAGATADTEKTSSGSDMDNFKFSGSKTSNIVSTNFSGATATSPQTNGFSFTPKKPETTLSTNPSTTSAFRFALNTSTVSSTASTSTTTPSFSFSLGNQSKNTNPSDTPPKPFSFTPGGTPFSFGNIKPPDVSAAPSGGDTNEEEDEEPPKNEFKQVVEDDAVYSKKCKVFVKKDGNFVDKGVGTLYLKPVESSGKTQLLVRADTNLGNILVNLILNSAIPTQRMGKNNVMMVCLPTPDIEKPTSMLLRVKTSEEADELLEKIDKYKK